MDSVNLSTIKLGIVCPMANEKATAEKFVKDVLSRCHGFKNVTMFVVLDGQSKDGTVELLREIEQNESRLKVVWAPENKCVVDAYVQGYQAALKNNCDWILEIDAGYSHQPNEIPSFFEKMSQGYDCVFGSRFCKGGKYTDAPLNRYLISRLGSQLINVLLGTRLSDMTSGFELFTRQSLNLALTEGIHSRGHFFQSEIKFHCRHLKVAEVPIHYLNPSGSVTGKIVLDAFQNLARLFLQRFKKRNAIEK